MIVCGFSIGAVARTNDAGTSSGNFLRFGSGAKGPAMGDALTSLATGYAALHYNPAGLGFTDRAEIGAMYDVGALDIGQGEIGFVHPINFASTWGMGVTYLDYGKTQRVFLSDLINSNIPSTSFTGQDMSVKISYGRAFNEWFAAGLTGKVINEEIDNSSATAVAADFGLMLAPTNAPVRFGLTGANLGTSMKFNNIREDLPALLRAGVAVDLFDKHVTISAEAEKVRNQYVSAQFGGEFRWSDMLAFRVGYDGRLRDLGGLTAGVGIKVSDLAVDYAYAPYGVLGNNHRLSLICKFGPKY